MILVLCYDVCKDKRRNRLFKKLKGFLRPVQESVFEGDLPDRRWGELLEMIQKTIEPTEDSVRIYCLCRSCRGLTRLIGVSPPIPSVDEPILL